MGLSPLELGVCLVIVVLLFGVKRLPELGTGLGRGISNFRKAFREGHAIDVSPQDSDQSGTDTTKVKSGGTPEAQAEKGSSQSSVS